MSRLVLSLFPGIGLLDMAFEEQGFCVVRGPDLLWGGDIRRFRVPPGKFDGIIGGPPCQSWSRLRHVVMAKGYETAPDLIPEFVRCIGEGQPQWFLMENVEGAPGPAVDGYIVEAQMLRDVWCGGKTSRLRRFHFGTRDGRKLNIETLALHSTEPEPAALAVGGARKFVNRRIVWVSRTFDEHCAAQGLPPEFLKDAPFTVGGKVKAIGNGVPLPMGRAVAKAVLAACGEKSPSMVTRQPSEADARAYAEAAVKDPDLRVAEIKAR